MDVYGIFYCMSMHAYYNLTSMFKHTACGLTETETKNMPEGRMNLKMIAAMEGTGQGGHSTL